MIQVQPLARHPDSISELARWHFAEWNRLFPNWTLEAVETELRGHLDPNRIPTTLVAVEDAAVVGSVSLIEEDLPGWEHLSPWLASLYVRPDRRHRGIGRTLVRHVVSEAGRFGASMLYLFTPGQRAFYAELGWNVLAETVCGREPVTVMSHAIRRTAIPATGGEGPDESSDRVARP